MSTDETNGSDFHNEKANTTLLKIYSILKGYDNDGTSF